MSLSNPHWTKQRPSAPPTNHTFKRRAEIRFPSAPAPQSPDRIVCRPNDRQRDLPGNAQGYLATAAYWGASGDETLGHAHRTPSNIRLQQLSRSSLATASAKVPAATDHLALEPPLATFRSHKRARQPEDNDQGGDNPRPRKKRRLRHDLITSKLSKPYAVPPTFIPTRPPLRVGVWARQRLMRRDLLRKAAVFNSMAMRGRSRAMRGVDRQHQTGEAPLMAYIFLYKPYGAFANKIRYCPPARQTTSRSLSPSRQKQPDPHNTGEYDEFDAITLIDDDEEEEDGELDGVIYSDFNMLRAEGDEAEVDIYDEDYSFDSFDGGQILTPEDGAKAMNLVMEIETKSEVSFAPGIS
ncbi:MAG: hypothetical protein Q9217_002042 [Psora testacea]